MLLNGFVDFVVKAVTMDRVLHAVLKFVGCEQNVEKEWFVVET